MEYARSIEKEHGKCFRFTITTNGVLLNDENIEYINREMSNAVLSIDGRKEVNDRMRPTVNGKGSYDVIVPKFQKLIAGRGDKDYYLRGTFTRDNLDFAADVMHMASLGAKNISVEPVVGGAEDPYALREEDVPAILAEYEKLAEELREHPEVNFFHFNVDLAQGPCVIKRPAGLRRPAVSMWPSRRKGISTPATSSWATWTTSWATSMRAPSTWRSPRPSPT